MLTIEREDGSKRGHRMVLVRCSFCDTLKSVRYTSLPVINSCGCFQKSPKVIPGDVFKNNTGLNAVVVSVIDNTKIKVKFLDGTGFEDYYKLTHLKIGVFKNPMHASVHGVGFFGIKLRDGYNKTKYHKAIIGVWNKMISRCYNVEDKNYCYYGAKGVIVSSEWLNFQNFLSWCIDNDWSADSTIDKDLLCPKDGSPKIYSKETCCVVPQSLNSKLVLPANPSFCYRYKGVGKFRVRVTEKGVRNLIGTYENENDAVMAYKLAKEKQVRDLALEYKGVVHEKVLEALREWVIPVDILNIALKWTSNID